ncbi:MAG: YicC family protein [Gemmatimonadota bacterium]|jgi:uncharacterized protein (TIGR00255 family)|nr:YicC family protein [Gemmatimonadota bacterium]
MTGYGEAERTTPAGLLRVELRTVNHRYLHTNFRTPQALSRLEPEMRDWLRGSFVRGSVNCTVRLDAETALRPAGVAVDEERVAAYLSAFRDLGERFGVPGTPDLALLVRFGDVLIRDREPEAGVELDPEELRVVIRDAAAATTRMREDEGQRLAEDLRARLDAITVALRQIEHDAPGRLVSERDRLRGAIRELAGGVAVDEARLAQEIALLAERWDLHEELVRFRSHIELFRELLGADPEEAVGKRLGFLVQEMHREANTIGSKANHAGIAHRVVAIKDEIERLREQVENVE